MTNPVILQGRTLGSGNLVQQTILYNDYAWRDTFYFMVAPGTYRVTIAVGWPGSCRNGDTEFVQVNGVIVREFRCSTSPGTCCNSREYSATVTVRGNRLLVMNTCPVYEYVSLLFVERFMLMELMQLW